MSPVLPGRSAPPTAASVYAPHPTPFRHAPPFALDSTHAPPHASGSGGSGENRSGTGTPTNAGTSLPDPSADGTHRHLLKDTPAPAPPSAPFNEASETNRPFPSRGRSHAAHCTRLFKRPSGPSPHVHPPRHNFRAVCLTTHHRLTFRALGMAHLPGQLHHRRLSQVKPSTSSRRTSARTRAQPPIFSLNAPVSGLFNGAPRVPVLFTDIALGHQRCNGGDARLFRQSPQRQRGRTTEDSMQHPTISRPLALSALHILELIDTLDRSLEDLEHADRHHVLTAASSALADLTIAAKEASNRLSRAVLDEAFDTRHIENALRAANLPLDPHPQSEKSAAD